MKEFINNTPKKWADATDIIESHKKSIPIYENLIKIYKCNSPAEYKCKKLLSLRDEGHDNDQINKQIALYECKKPSVSTEPPSLPIPKNNNYHPYFVKFLKMRMKIGM